MAVSGEHHDADTIVSETLKGTERGFFDRIVDLDVAHQLAVSGDIDDGIVAGYCVFVLCLEALRGQHGRVAECQTVAGLSSAQSLARDRLKGFHLDGSHLLEFGVAQDGLGEGMFARSLQPRCHGQEVFLRHTV